MTLSGPFKLSRVVFRLVGLVSIVAASGPARAQFETRALTKFPNGASSIAVGDFNNDGKLDVVMMTDNGFAVALGNGDGTFQTPKLTRTGLAYSLAVADFNNDGNLDIVVADDNLSPSTVSVYLGNGDGSFQSAIKSGTTSYNEFVTVGDFNNDGKMDIVVIENPYVSVLLGNGDGTFQPPSDNNSFVGGQWLAVADFNNDGKLDVVVTGSFGSSYNIGVLLGNGNGALQDAIIQPLQFVPGTVAAGDLNGDGKMDAVLAYDLGGLAVFLGNGDGTFQPPVNYNTTGISYYVQVDDLNHDGKLDVAVPATDGFAGGVDIFWGNGDGTLQQAQFFATAVSGIPAIGDLNGDLLPDFVFGNTDYGVETMLGTGVVSFSPNTAPIAFPVQLINTVSAKQMVNLSNNGSTPLSISAMKVSGPFEMTTTCGKRISSGASCSISATFSPKRGGELTGAVTIIDSASSKPQFVELTGSSTVIKLSPTVLHFGDQTVGTSSAPQTVTATNDGDAAISFYSVGLGQAAKKNFTATENCTNQPLQPGASCTAAVTFTPTQAGADGGQLFFTVGVNQINPVPVQLLGTGAQAAR